MPAPRATLLRIEISRLALLLTAALLSHSTSAWALVPTILPTSDPVWSADGSDRYELFGASVSAAGDVNGDGFSDVIIGAPGWGGIADGALANRGRALVFSGSRNGLSSIPTWTVEGTRIEGALGFAVDGAGDVNGDGFADVIVGEYGFSTGQPWRGRARVFLGSRSGPRASQAWEFNGQTQEEMGRIVAGVGDVNGDGFDDVLIGSLVRTLVFHGRRSGIEKQPAWVGPPPTISAGGAGDINRDGYDDVVFAGGPGTLVFAGSSSGLSPHPVWTGRPALYASGGGDVNGDGFDDVLLGPPDITSHTASLFSGSASGLSSDPIWESAHSAESLLFFGLSLSIDGDVNHDGFDDVLIHAGMAAILYLGGSRGPSAAPDWVGRIPGSGVERVVAMAGDVNGDASADVLYGAPDHGVNTGRVALFQLGAGYPVPAIIHDSPAGLVALGTPIPLEARVMDQTRSLSRVEIRYRLIEEPEESAPIVMEHVGSDLYRGVIPASFTGWGLVYSIRATDDYGLVAETELFGIEFSFPEAAASRFSVAVRPQTYGHSGGIEFTLTRPGPAKVRIFDVRGRLVGTLLDERSLAAGRHEATFAGHGLRVASGVYFYRVDTREGSKGGRYVVLR